MLNLFRRQIKNCPDRPKGRDSIRCVCPIWVDGALNGQDYRRSLKTTDWRTATLRMLTLEENAPHDNAVSISIETLVAAPRRTELARYPKNVNSGRAGAVAELIVALDLMDRGFEVYRPFHNTARFDAIAVIGDKTLRVEVKSAAVSKSGRIDCEITNHGHFDILALVSNGNVSYYASFDLDATSKRPRLTGTIQKVLKGRKTFCHPPEIDPADLIAKAVSA